MKQAVKLVGFILILIGTLGLLITEFIYDWGRAGWVDFTIIFGSISAVGLATLAFAHWSMR